MQKITLFLGILYLCSCVDKSLESDKIMEDSATEALIIFSDKEFPIACFYFDPSKSDYGQSLPIFNQAWVWAKIPGYSHLIAEGKLSDGFFVADKVRGWSFSKDKGPLLNDDPDNIERICQESIDSKYPDKKLKLYKIEAFKSIIDHKGYPLISGESKANNKLTRMVIFGDSLSDNGNLKNFMQIFPDTPYFLGRFSNGPVWNDFLSTMANLTVQNMAYGGAVAAENVSHRFKEGEFLEKIKDIGRNFITGSLSLYVDEFIEKLTDNHLESPDRTLFVIWMGANDYMSKFDSAKDLTDMLDHPDLPKKGGNYIVDLSIKSIVNEIINLYQIGARLFLVANLPDIGLSPNMTAEVRYKEGDKTLTVEERRYLMSKGLSNLSKLHNKKLLMATSFLREVFNDATIIDVDMFSALNKLVEGIGPDGEQNFDYGIDPNRYVKEIQFEGKDPIKVGLPCYSGSYVGESNFAQKMCSNAKDWFYWDPSHPTSVAHCAIAYFFHKAIYDASLLSTKPSMSDYQEHCIK